MEEVKVSQREIKFIAEFLDNFDLDDDDDADGNNRANSSDATEADVFTHKHLEKVRGWCILLVILWMRLFLP